MLGVGPEYGFGLYIHWPFCARICPYCDFNVYAAKDRDSEDLVDAILADLESHRKLLPAHPELDSIFFGGGTPSLLRGHQVAKIIGRVATLYGLNGDAEVTLEANPNDILRHDPRDWANAGVNRVSLGVQSLDDEALHFLGRDHDAGAALKALDRIQPVFDNHSVDLIYARPGQSLDQWEAELTDTLALGAPHLSLYELTIEERTAFGKRAARGELTPMEDDAQADLYELTQEICEARGLPAYEVSNHARSEAYQSAHNHIYWASGDWIGVGPGAHGRLTLQGRRIATEAARRPGEYVSSPAPNPSDLSQSDTAREFLAMALRPLSGLDLTRFEQLFGQAPDPGTLQDLEESGHVEVSGSALHLTQSGRLMADYIASLLAPY
ncbi:MAG: radical SAM family heme chaperone HemW [Pseudomonadota bacterium]